MTYFLFRTEVFQNCPSFLIIAHVFSSGIPCSKVAIFFIVVMIYLGYLPKFTFFAYPVSDFYQERLFFYLMFLMGGGVALARRIVGGKKHIEQDVVVDQNDENPYRDFATRPVVVQLLKVLAASVVIMGISVAVGSIVGGESGISMVALILTITTLSLLMTISKQVRSWDKSYDAGMYLIYVFCLVMATMADLSSINWEQSLFVLMLQAVIIFGSLFVTIFLARPLRIDADTAVITSNTLINSPVCVPMIAATMKNRDVVVVGITNGLAGYAVGNYLGYLLYQMLLVL